MYKQLNAMEPGPRPVWLDKILTPKALRVFTFYVYLP